MGSNGHDASARTSLVESHLGAKHDRASGDHDGLYLIAGRFVYDALRRKRTVYGLTTERVIISGGVLRPTLKSLALTTLTDLTLDQRSDGSGTISFGPALPFALAGTDWPGMPRPPAFELIPNAKQVYDRVREAQRSASRPAA